MSSEPPRILVLDANRNSALSFIRSLHRKGVEVTAGSRSRFTRGTLSRAASGTYVYPNPVDRPTRFVRHLADYLEQNEYVAVVPMTDPTHSVLSKHKELIESTGTAVGVEEWETFVKANDKRRIAALATELSIPIPETYAPASLDEIVERADEFTYPVLLKPRLTSVVGADGSYTEQRISGENYVESPAALVSAYRSFLEHSEHSLQEPPLVQEVVPGATMATTALAENGACIAHFQEERLRTYPVDGGVGALRVGVREPEMVQYATTIIEALEWTGPIYVEFMRLPDGTFRLIEVNGRYWGSLALAVNSGVDFPWLHYQQLSGDTPEWNGRYRTDVRQRRLFYRDINWLRTKLSTGEYGAMYPFVTSFFNSREEVLTPHDPLPLVGVAWETVKQLAETGWERTDDLWTERNEVDSSERESVSMATNR